jgi:site-specific recombinase XerD
MNYIDQFLDFLQYQRGLSENTLHSYGFDLREYLGWLGVNKLDQTLVRVRDIDSFLIRLRKNGNSIQTVNQKMYCLKTFYRWLLRIEVIEKNPMDLFQNTKGPQKIPRYLINGQQEALLISAQNGIYEKPWIKKRNYLIILFLLNTGVRIGELCNLELKNINLDEGIFKVIGKGSKEREMVLSSLLKEEIKEYLGMVTDSKFEVGSPFLPSRGFNIKTFAKEMKIPFFNVMGALGGNSRKGMEKIQTFADEKIKPLPVKFLFFNETGKPMITRHAFRIVREIGERAGIEGLHPHLLRHTFATNLRERGADLLLMKEALGHSSVSTTQIYAHIGNGKYKSELRKFIN